MKARWVVVVALLIAVTIESNGQETGSPAEEQRGIQTAPSEAEAAQPAETEGPEIDRTPVLPELGPAAPGAGLTLLDGFTVREIRVDGRSLVSAQQVDAAVKDYLSRPVSVAELDRLRQELSALYFDRGYVNSGVVLPDQAITDGVIRFEEVRGRLTDIRLQGNRALRDRYWTDRLAAFEQAPLQINALQSTLQVIEQHPLVNRVQAQLMPGSHPGESSLYLAVDETSPWKLELGIDNYRSPSLGGEQATVYAAHHSLTGRGDLAEIYGNLSDGLGDGGLSYTLPAGWQGAQWRAYYSAGDAQIVEKPFDLIDIRSQVWTWGVEASRPLYRTPARSLVVALGIESQHSESTLLGIPFSFSLGEVDGEATAVASFLRAEWLQRNPRGLFAVRVSLRQGLDGLGALSQGWSPSGLNGPDNEFLSLRGQIQYVRRLEWLESELHARGAFQFAHDPLLPVEKMPVGGVHSVRGYRENLLVRDNGLSASIEWRVPLFLSSRGESRFQLRALTLAAFADFGQSWDQDTGLPSDHKQRIYSVGAGLLWQPLDSFSTSVYYGEGLKDMPAGSNDLQDRGWHFRASYRY